MTGTADMEWPTLPFLGLRRFEGADRALYCARKHDIQLCSDRLSNPAVRVLVLQGLSGSGKSSFLRAGLLPEVDRLLLQEPKEGIVPICSVVHAGTGMMENIARQVYEFVIRGRGRSMWNKQAGTLAERYPELEAFVADAAKNTDTLIDFISELSRNPRYSVLIAIDQVEEIWSMPSNEASTALQDSFFRLVYEFALERLSGKLVLSIRTEQYGIFASKLPDSTVPAFAELRGVNRLCHHYLANPSHEELVAMVEHPMAHYGFTYDTGLPELMVKALRTAAADPEMCVLPLLQTVLLRLYLGGKAKAEAVAAPMVITTAAFQALLETAEGTRVGLLQDFVRWGLGQAVAHVLQEDEARREWRFRKQREVSCWQAVLPAMSYRNSSGVRIRRISSVDEIETLARDAECEASALSMIEALSRADVGLLASTDKPDSFTLQHDLICLTFDQTPIVTSPGFWLQADRFRRKRIDKAADYRLKDLFVGDEPPVEKLRIAELRFWDHKTLAYANKLGFFDRLGFSVECVSCDEDISATDLVRKLECDHDTHAVYSYPRVLMSRPEMEASQDIVVLNSFTGFAVICNAAAALPCFQESSGWNSFDEVTEGMLALGDHDGSYLAEDNLAKDFFEHLLTIEQFRRGDDVTATSARRSAVCSDEAGISFVERLLRETSPCIAIVTAPTWALAMMLGEDNMKTVIDQRTLLRLLDDEGTVVNHRLSAIRRKLEVRNVMNLQLARDRTGSDNEPMMMRLASIGLFLADWIWAQDVKAGEWIRTQWSSTAAGAHDHGRRISLPAFLNTFRRSCGFSASHEHADRYFGAPWSDDCATALDIHHKLRQAQMHYEKQTVALGALASQLDGVVSEPIIALIHRARKHADINNYYDAKRLIDEAMVMLSSAQQPF